MPTVTELFDGRSGGIEAGGKGNEGIQRRHVRRFRVITDDWRHGTLHVVPATGIPRIGDPYVCLDIADLAARCHSVEPEATGEPRVWTVTASYSTSSADIGDIDKEKGTAADTNDPNNNSGDQGSSGSSDANNPLARPAEIVYETQQTTEIATLGFSIDDINVLAVKVPLTSSAGEPVDPPIEVPSSEASLTVTRNESGFNPTLAKTYRNKINLKPWFGFGAGEVRCVGISAKSGDEGGHRFWVVTYTFAIRETWNVKFLDQGYYQIVGGNKETILDFGGGRLSAPWPLDGNGEELTPADVAAGNFHYREYRVHEYADFNALRLP